MSNFKNWFRDARERVTSTAVEVAGAIASVELFVAQTGIGAESWQRLTAYGVVATVLSVVKTIAAARVGDANTAGVTRSFRDEDADVDCCINADDDASK